MTRVDIINLLAIKINAEKYLEIGVLHGDAIRNVIIKNKVGVDVNNCDNIEGWQHNIMTSDEFFKTNKTKFDVVFIDGLHEYSQVLRDIINAWNALSLGGFIVMHDCNPTCKSWASKEQCPGSWMGDVWKSVFDLINNYPNVKVNVVDTDCGCGVIQKTSNDILEYKYNQEIDNLEYEFLEQNRNEVLNLISVEEFKEWIK